VEPGFPNFSLSPSSCTIHGYLPLKKHPSELLLLDCGSVLCVSSKRSVMYIPSCVSIPLCDTFLVSYLKFSRHWKVYVITLRVMATRITTDVSDKPTGVLRKKQEAICSSKTSALPYQTKRCHNPEDYNVNLTLCT
jgi:hypothetical protein